MGQNTTQSEMSLDTTPKSWPGAFGVYQYSKKIVMGNLGTVLGLVGLSILASIASGMMSGGFSLSYDPTAGSSMSDTLVNVLSQLISVWLSAAIAIALISSVKKIRKDINTSLREAWSIFWPYFAMNILLGLIYVASILCLIVPAFFVIPRLLLAPYFFIEGKNGVSESIRLSWQASKGHMGKIWGIIGFSTLLVLLAVTIVGIPFTIYFSFMYQAALIVLYFYIKSQNKQSA